MPQDGSNNYQYPPGTPGIPDTTIESEAYNTFLDDLVINDLNIARPIHRGGTGATTAHAALIALNGEEALQIVANYDTFPFAPGSFRSSPGATGTPPAGGTAADYFMGICYKHNDDDVAIEARQVVAAVIGKRYVRQKHAAVWSAWELQVGPSSDLNAGPDAKVSRVGDVMSGDLTVTRSGSGAPATGYVQLGNTGKFIGYDGTNFALNAGMYSTGNIGAVGNVSSNDKVIASTNVYTGYANPVGGTYYFGSNATRYLTHDGANTFTLAGGDLNASQNIIAGGEITAIGNAIRFGSTTGSTYLVCDGTNYTLSPGQLNVAGINTGAIHATGTLYVGSGVMWLNSPTNSRGITWDGLNLDMIGASKIRIDNAGRVLAGRGIMSRSGLSGTDGSVSYTLNWVGGSGAFYLAADDTGLGFISVTSDYRIKKDVVDLPGTWDTVKAPRPIKYTQAEYNPPSAMKEASGPLFAADNIERWGFIAHELQETLIQSAATAVKDDPVHIQSPNPWTVIAALTKALQEAMARIEALEGGVTELSK